MLYTKPGACTPRVELSAVARCCQHHHHLTRGPAVPLRLLPTLTLDVECPLCESLEEKLRSALEAASFSGGVLAQCTLETRVDLQSQDTPFLRFIPGGTTQEVELPRPSPRVTPSKLAQQLDGWLHTACGGGDNAAAMPWDAVQGRAWPPQG